MKNLFTIFLLILLSGSRTQAQTQAVTVNTSGQVTNSAPYNPFGTGSTNIPRGNDFRFPASVTGIRLGAGNGSSDTALIIGSGLTLNSGTLTASGGTWGQITGTLSNQTDLNSALTLKASLAGNNTWTGSNNFTGGLSYNGTSVGTLFPSSVTGIRYSTGAGSTDTAATGTQIATLLAGANLNVGSLQISSSSMTIIDSNGNLYYSAGNQMTNSFGQLFMPDGSSVLADNNGNTYSDLPVGSILASGGTGYPITAALAKNLPTTNNSMLYVGWSGNTGGGQTWDATCRPFLLFSNDYVHASLLPGFESYTPPTYSGHAVGLRDPAVLRVPTTPPTYLFYFDEGYGTTPITQFLIVKSTNLKNFTTVSTPTESTAQDACKWFQDPVSGNTYLISGSYYKQNTSTTGGYPDGVSWGTATQFTFSGSYGIGAGQDSNLVYDGTYYHLYTWPSSAGNVCHDFRATTFAGPYTDEGAITNWSKEEGLSIRKDSTGQWHAWMWDQLSNRGTMYSVSPAGTLTTSSWTGPSGSGASVALSTYSTYPQAAFNNGFWSDNGDAWVFTDSDTLRDTLSGTVAPSIWVNPASTVTGGGASNPQIAVNITNPAALTNPGTGTISLTGGGGGYEITGTGTRFTSELQRGTAIKDTNSNLMTIAWVNSDTDAFVQYSGEGSFGNSWTNGSTFTRTWSPFTLNGGTSSNGVYSFVTPAGETMFYGNGAMGWWYPWSNSGYSGSSMMVDWTSGGTWELRNNNGSHPLQITGGSSLAMDGACQLTSTGLVSAGKITATNYLATSGTPSASSGGTNVTGTPTVTGSNQAGTISVVLSGASSGVITTVTLANSLAYPTKAITELSPGNAAAANLLIADEPYTTGTASTWVINTSGTGVPSGTYVWNYVTSGY